jgi:hypothetical protein
MIDEDEHSGDHLHGSDSDRGGAPCPPGSLKSGVAKHLNWVDKEGGLPRYIERIACHVHFDRGEPVGEAIAFAVNDCKKMCASGESNFGHVHPQFQTEACAAVADWERMRASAHAKGNIPKLK